MQSQSLTPSSPALNLGAYFPPIGQTALCIAAAIPVGMYMCSPQDTLAVKVGKVALTLAIPVALRLIADCCLQSERDTPTISTPASNQKAYKIWTFGSNEFERMKQPPSSSSSSSTSSASSKKVETESSAATPSTLWGPVTLLAGAASSLAGAASNLIPKEEFDPFTGDSFAHLAGIGVKEISFKITKTAPIKLQIQTLAGIEDLKFVEKHWLPPHLSRANKITFNGQRVVLQPQESDETIDQRIQKLIDQRIQELVEKKEEDKIHMLEHMFQKPVAVFSPENCILVLGQTEYGEIPFVMPQHLYYQISKAPGQVVYGKKLKINMSIDPAVVQVTRRAITRHAELQIYDRGSPEIFAQLHRINNKKIKQLPLPSSLQSKTAGLSKKDGGLISGVTSAIDSVFTRQPNPLIDDLLPQLVNQLRQQGKHSATIKIEKAAYVKGAIGGSFYGFTRITNTPITHEAFFPRCMRTNVPVKESLLDPKGNKVTFRKDRSVKALNEEPNLMKERYGICSTILRPHECILISGTVEKKEFVFLLPERYYQQIQLGKSAIFSYDGFPIEIKKETHLFVDQAAIASFTVPEICIFTAPERMCHNISSFPKENFIQYDKDQKKFEKWLSSRNQPECITTAGEYHWKDWTEKTNYWNTESEYSRLARESGKASRASTSSSTVSISSTSTTTPLLESVEPSKTQKDLKLLEFPQ